MRNFNELILTGIVKSVVQSHWYKGQIYHRMEIETNRADKTTDIVPVVITEKLLKEKKVLQESIVTLTGAMRTLNKMVDGKSKLLVFGEVHDIEVIDEDTLQAIDVLNEVTIEGFVVKNPNYRITPRGKIITDLRVACNREFGKSDYFPCITWNMEAEYAKHLKVGEKITLTGRFQSRVIFPVGSDKTKTHLTYEVSILRIASIRNIADNVVGLKVGA